MGCVWSNSSPSGQRTEGGEVGKKESGDGADRGGLGWIDYG